MRLDYLRRVIYCCYYSIIKWFMSNCASLYIPRARLCDTDRFYFFGVDPGVSLFHIRRFVLNIICNGMRVHDGSSGTNFSDVPDRFISYLSTSRIIKTALSLITTTHFADLHISAVKRRANITIYCRRSRATQSLTMFNTRLRDRSLRAYLLSYIPRAFFSSTSC